MFKNKRKTLLISISVVLLLGMSSNIFGQPGTELDPLVTLKYVEKRVEDLKGYIDKKIKASSNNSSGSDLEIVTVKKGSKLICGTGTEIILRTGAAKVITSKAGGISDLTQGYDLKEDETIRANHLLLIPRDDGRGAYVEKDAIFIVRGLYSIK